MSQRLLDRVALAVACVALALLGLRPATTRLVDPAIVVVRTPGATMAEARLIADSLHAGAIVDASDHAAFDPAGAELHLVGWGLDAGELRRARGHAIVLHPRPLPDGIREVSWSGPLVLGDVLTVRATLRGPAGRYLVLSDDTGPVDSMRLPGNEPTTLVVRHTPPAVGVARYVLRLGTRSDTFSVFVAAAEPPAALILTSAPAREWSDLRDWLAAQGAVVTLRTTLSRDRIATDRINSPAPGDRLTTAALSRTGLVITDGRTLAALPAAERAALRDAIAGGLGLLLLHDRAARERRGLPAGDIRFFLPWRATTAGEIDTRDVRPRHEGHRPSETPVSAEAYVLAAAPDAVPIFDDGQGGILASTIRQGGGRITATMVTGPGRWLRGGEPAAYAAYWSTLIRSTTRADATTPRWDAGRGPVRLHNEVTLVRWGGVAGEVPVGGWPKQFATDPLIPGRSVAQWWPGVPGWTPLDQERVWVSDSAAWPALRAAERRRLTEAAIGRERGTAAAGTQVPRRVPWPLWPCYLGFVLAVGWLWRRIGN